MVPLFRTRAAIALPLLASLLAWAAPVRAESWRPLDGAAVRRAFSGHEFGDGTHYAHRFHADGTLEGAEMGRPVQGRWRVEGSRLCTARTKPRPADECFDAERSGDEVRLLSRGYVVYSGRFVAIPSPRAKGARPDRSSGNPAARVAP